MTDGTSFAKWQEHLASAAVPIGAAEAHGVVTGLVCGGVESDEIAASVLGDPGNDPGFPLVLATIRKQIHQQLAERAFRFTLLLPTDDVPLVQRSHALTRWCAGFIAGFSRGVRQRDAHTDGAEFLADVVALADAAGTVGEADYAEIVEYLRVGVQIVYEEHVSDDT